jgi:hypothetical protein
MRSKRRRAHQWRSRLVGGLIDALVTQPHHGLAREPQPQLAADLLRAPPPDQEPGDQLPQLTVSLDPPPAAPGPPCRGAAVGLERPVTTSHGVAAQLTRYRRRRPAQLISDLPDAQARVRRSAISIRSSCDRNLALTSRTASRSSAGTNPVTWPFRYVL